MVRIPSFTSRSPMKASYGVPRRNGALCLTLSLLMLVGCIGDEPRYRATIRRTSHGVPHILAYDLGSAAFGQGYAFAQDHACTLADQIVKIRSERAKYFGAGPQERHLNSDFAYRSLGIYERAKAALAKQSRDVLAMLAGYTAGYNAYIEETGVENIPGRCRGADWVHPIGVLDLMAYQVDIGLSAGSNHLLNEIGGAAPPAVTPSDTRRRGHLTPHTLEQWVDVHREGPASNGWAIGQTRSLTGRGMLVGNPHFPWEGELRLWESHITVPGRLNVYGSSLLGMPGVAIGFNDQVAWTLTFSAGKRFTLYKLPLVPGKPTSYYYDGEERAMTSSEHTIQVRQPDGTMGELKRTLYHSHYGPMIVLSPLVWSDKVAFAIRDANLDNDALLAHFYGMSRARNMAELQKAHEHQGIAWTNTVAVDRAGNSWYADSSPTPNLRPEAIQAWVTAVRGADPLVRAVFDAAGFVLLDGSKSINEWVDDASAARPGLEPFAKNPQLARNDFVFNANDSHWLTNPELLLEGYSPLHGLERTPQSVRTRMNATLLTEVREGGASGADGKFTFDELKQAILSNRGLMGELLKDQVVERCRGVDTVDVSGVLVSIREACSILSAWDGRFDAQSVGAVVWREFIGAHKRPALLDVGPLFAVGFDAKQPVTTPHTLAPAPTDGKVDEVLQKLARAVIALKSAGIALDASLGSAQYHPRGDEHIALHGGLGNEGVVNVVNFGMNKSALDADTPRGTVVTPGTGLTSTGYTINYGTSFLLALEFTDKGVRADALLTYGESEDPASPYYSDQLRLYAAKKWRKVRFSEAEIAEDPALEVTRVEGQTRVEAVLDEIRGTN